MNGESSSIKYCVGFYVDKDGNILMIRKNKPAWQNGFLNGLGGKLKSGESAVGGMVREFEEESGIKTTQDSWFHFCAWTWADKQVNFFISQENTFSTHFIYEVLKGWRVLDEGVLRLVNIKKLDKPDVIPNIKWLVPMAKQIMSDNLHKVYIVEGGNR